MGAGRKGRCLATCRQAALGGEGSTIMSISKVTFEKGEGRRMLILGKADVAHTRCQKYVLVNGQPLGPGFC